MLRAEAEKRAEQHQKAEELMRGLKEVLKELNQPLPELKRARLDAESKDRNRFKTMTAEKLEVMEVVVETQFMMK